MAKPEADLIDAARAGDEWAYAVLVERYRASVQAHCYRMLGSLHDAEDAAQEAFLGAWRGLSQFEGRSSLRTWLFTIATHACLRLLTQRTHRVLPVEHGPPADPRHELPEATDGRLWIEPYPDDEVSDGRASPEARYEELESLELAFIAALQHLPATQRAVLILRDVLGFSANEIASIVDTSVPSVNSALQRARGTLEGRLHERSQAATRRALGKERHRHLIERFIAAWEKADVDAIVALLADDAVFTMPRLPSWYSGREDIRAFLAGKVFAQRWRFFPLRASGQPSMAAYQWSAETSTYRLAVLNVFTLRDDRVSAITSFLAPEVIERFGLLTSVDELRAGKILLDPGVDGLG